MGTPANGHPLNGERTEPPASPLLALAIEAFEAAGADAGVVYVSVPITSGRREFVLLRELECARDELRTRFRDRWIDEVVRPNEEDARRYVQEVRATFLCHLVVDPSRVHVTEWTQDDFDRLWSTVIGRYGQLVVVTPGWAFSRGARLEVALAVSIGIPVAGPDGDTLTSSGLRAMVEQAEAELLADGWSREAIRSLLPEFQPGPVPPEFLAQRRAPTPKNPAAEAFSWLVDERRYQLRKFGTERDDEHTRQGLHPDGWWWRQLTNYFGRADVLNLANLNGRQALAKFTATACGLLESAVRVHGKLPDAGVPSGELLMTEPEPHRL